MFKVLVDANFEEQCGQGCEGIVGVVVGWIGGREEVSELGWRLYAVL